MGSAASSCADSAADPPARPACRRQTGGGGDSGLFRRPPRNLEDQLPFAVRAARHGPLAAKLAAAASGLPAEELPPLLCPGYRPKALPTSCSLKKHSKFGPEMCGTAGFPSPQAKPGFLAPPSLNWSEAAPSWMTRPASLRAPLVRLDSAVSLACISLGDDLDEAVALRCARRSSSSNSSGGQLYLGDDLIDDKGGCGSPRCESPSDCLTPRGQSPRGLSPRELSPPGGPSPRGLSPPGGLSPRSPQSSASGGELRGSGGKRVGFKPAWELEQVLK